MALQIRLSDSPLRIAMEEVRVWNLEFTLGDTGPVYAFLTKESLGGIPDPDLATATITFNMWGYVDGVDTHILEDLVCTVLDEPTGYVEFELPPAGIIYEGDSFRGRYTVAYLDGRVESYPRGRQYINILVRGA